MADLTKIRKTYRSELCAWLTENGIDPGQVPDDDCLPHVDEPNRTIRITVLTRNRRGRFVVRGNRIARSVVAFPLLTETWVQRFARAGGDHG